MANAPFEMMNPKFFRRLRIDSLNMPSGSNGWGGFAVDFV
jgi:hypothetical protein